MAGSKVRFPGKVQRSKQLYNPIREVVLNAIQNCNLIIDERQDLTPVATRVKGQLVAIAHKLGPLVLSVAVVEAQEAIVAPIPTEVVVCEV